MSIDMDKVRQVRENAKRLVVMDGEPHKREYRIKVYGGICDGVQVIDFESKDAAMAWMMGEAFPSYASRGKTLRPRLK